MPIVSLPLLVTVLLLAVSTDASAAAASSAGTVKLGSVAHGLACPSVTAVGLILPLLLLVVSTDCCTAAGGAVFSVLVLKNLITFCKLSCNFFSAFIFVIFLPHLDNFVSLLLANFA